MNVQTFLSKQAAKEPRSYEIVTCPACTAATSIVRPLIVRPLLSYKSKNPAGDGGVF
jgi:hypothetical protein